MNFENSFNASVEKEVLDKEWFKQFDSTSNFTDYDYLKDDNEKRAKSMDIFIETGEVSLDYPKLEELDFDKLDEGLLKLKIEIKEQEQSEALKLAYVWKINEKLAELRMLKATKEGDSKRFSRYSEYVHGKPDETVFHYDLQEVRKSIDEAINTEDTEKMRYAKELENLVDWQSAERTYLENLKKFAVDNTKVEDLDDLETEYTAEEIKDAFERALQKEYGISGWKVLISNDSTAVNVDQDLKEINIPNDRNVKNEKLLSLIVHEIGTHALRRDNGDRSGLLLLGKGLDRNTRGEEGLATYGEQTEVKGFDDFPGLTGHLAISLVKGLDGKKRNFNDLFEILERYFILKSKKTGQDALDDASKKAWNRCVRTFRGTDGSTAGACFTKDIAYREGNIGIWTVVKDNEKETKRFMVGKYDPANFRHIWILEQLGITDKDLDDLNG